MSREDNDQIKQEPHDPVKSGKDAIEASRLANDTSASGKQQQEAEKKDAEQWHNEG